MKEILKKNKESQWIWNKDTINTYIVYEHFWKNSCPWKGMENKYMIEERSQEMLLEGARGELTMREEIGRPKMQSENDMRSRGQELQKWWIGKVFIYHAQYKCSNISFDTWYYLFSCILYWLFFQKI